MRRQLAGSTIFLIALALATPGNAGNALSVVSYHPGATATAGFNDPLSALGSPERFTGEGGSFPGVVSPFNPPFSATEIVSIGEGGHLTLRLSHFALPTSGPELGFFTNAGLGDQDYPNGLAASDFGAPFTTFGIDQATVEVSESGSDWTTLGTFTFDVPTNGYTDLANPFSPTPGSTLSDFTQPFVGGLSDFAGLRYSPDILSLLGGSGGGTWLDISSSGLSRVGYVRLSVDDDDPGSMINFELDGISVAAGALGIALPEPGSLLLLMSALAMSARTRR